VRGRAVELLVCVAICEKPISLERGLRTEVTRSPIETVCCARVIFIERDGVLVY
jgi:hypothetical protein